MGYLEDILSDKFVKVFVLCLIFFLSMALAELKASVQRDIDRNLREAAEMKAKLINIDGMFVDWGGWQVPTIC